MQFVCEHDPHNPDHLVCGAKWSRIDIALLTGAVVLVVGSVLFWPLRHPDPPAGGEGSRPNGRPTSVGDSSATPQNDGLDLQYSGQSEIYLESEALYFSKEGEQIGRGPWPLEAGKETKIKVFLKMYGGPSSEDSENGPRSIVVTGKLGPNVQWTGFVPIGQGISYEPETRTVRWNVRDESNAVFEVAITPAYAQAQEEHLTIMDTMTVLVRNTSGDIITKALTPDILLFLK